MLLKLFVKVHLVHTVENSNDHIGYCGWHVILSCAEHILQTSFHFSCVRRRFGHSSWIFASLNDYFNWKFICCVWKSLIRTFPIRNEVKMAIFSLRFISFYFLPLSLFHSHAQLNVIALNVFEALPCQLFRIWCQKKKFFSFNGYIFAGFVFENYLKFISRLCTYIMFWNLWTI